MLRRILCQNTHTVNMELPMTRLTCCFSSAIALASEMLQHIKTGRRPALHLSSLPRSAGVSPVLEGFPDLDIGY